jgi:aspartyl aminopeptidase
MIAFTVGAKFNADSSNFKIIGTHTDSPCLRLAPKSKIDYLEYQ